MGGCKFFGPHLIKENFKAHVCQLIACLGTRQTTAYHNNFFHGFIIIGMCGIVGYVGSNPALLVLLQGL
ncbi:MAG: hypothetical protein ACK4VK_04395, partial [Aquificaceae bacterium]